MSGVDTAARGVSFSDVTPAQWRSLESARLFFGHQSVGGNVLDGVADVLAAHPEIRLRVIDAGAGGAMAEPGLYHARVGRNGAPETKLEAFTAATRSLSGAGERAALLKFCYVDVTPATDPVALFESYRATVESVRAADPGLAIVHVTLPLTADRGTVFHLRTLVRGNGARSDRALNAIRHRYNELLRTTYGERDAIFDLAALESTTASGEQTSVKYAGERVPVLAREWTNDGGHLNEAGRRRAAEAFLATLATL